MQLRDYQQAAIDSLYLYWRSGKKNGLIIAPTGSGKSLIIAGICKRLITEHPGTRIICITDSRELIRQNSDELKRYWPEASTGIYSAGLNEKSLDGQIIFAGIQSVYQKVHDFYPAFDIVITDESHMISRSSHTRYGEFIKAIKTAKPSAVLMGLTATPYRLDSGLLYEGDDRLFDGVAYTVNIRNLISQGYLCHAISKGGIKHIDLSDVRTTAGDYNAGDLETAACDIVQSACKEIINLGHDRKSWLVFCAGVDHAGMVCRALISQGIPAEVVTGDTPTGQRDDIVGRFKTGDIRALINVGVFTKGFNAPNVDLIALLTATKSTAKYVQMVGRGLRTHPGKADCLILDMGNNIQTHGPIDAVNPHRPKESGDAPRKQCPECQAVILAASRECPECGYKYPEQDRTPKHETKASEESILSEPKWVPVRSIKYSRHIKEGKPDSIKITYLTGAGETYNSWLALDHGGFAAEQAFRFLLSIGSEATNVSEALAEALSGYWPEPTRIQVKKDGQFWRVLKYDYTKVMQQQLVTA